MGRSDILLAKRGYKQITSGDPFVIVTYIKNHIGKSDYSKYEVILGSSSRTVSIESYIKAHKSLW
jgi:hypothetical protein